MKNNNVVVLGATSAIAKNSCKALIEQGATLYLAGRNITELERLATDLKIRYSISDDNTIHYGYFDADDFESHPIFFDKALKTLKKIDGVLLAFGYLGNPENSLDFSEQCLIFNRNLVGAVSILKPFVDYFEKLKQGFIICITSVAGDRGRNKNCTYNASKSGLTTYLEGLNQRLFKSNVRVITIKPGVVDTPMTFGRTKTFLIADPEKVGRQIIKCLSKKRDVVYLPWFWRYIMIAIKFIPNFLFKRLSF